MEWNSISFLLVWPSFLLYFLVYIWLYFHTNLLFAYYFTFCYPLFSLFALQSQFSLKIYRHWLAPCSYLVFTQHPICLHPSALSLQSIAKSPVASCYMKWAVLPPHRLVQHQWPLFPHCNSLFLWLPASLTLLLSHVFLVSISFCFTSSCTAFQC